MIISRILDYITVDGCVFKTRVRYYINNGHLSIITDYARTPKNVIEHIDITNKEFKANQEIEKAIYHKEYSKSYYEDNRDPNIPRMGSEEHSIALSCGLQHIEIEDFNGFAPSPRPYVIPVRDCIKMNDWFPGSHAHHITKSIIIYIPKELHRHIPHNLKTGHNIGEINAVAIQFVNGGL